MSYHNSAETAPFIALGITIRLERTESGGPMPTFDECVPNSGIITDRAIGRAVEAGHLLERGTWKAESIRHASYTLRLGDRVELSRASDAGAETKPFSVVRLAGAGASVDLLPGDTALLFSIENLRIPENVVGFTVARGLLFAEGLAPENTYVDPGFVGPLYTTVVNVSNRVVRLEYGLPVARLFFVKLTEPVGDGYRSGASQGISQQLTTMRSTLVGTGEECARATKPQLISVLKSLPLCGEHLAELLRREARAREAMLAIAIAWPVLLVVANSSSWIQQNVGTFAGNVSASLVAAILYWAGPRLWHVVRRP